MIEVSQLRASELPALARLSARADAPCPLTAAEMETLVLLHGGEPRAILAVDPQGWLVARSAGRLLGFAHATVGRLLSDDPETMRGFLRTIILAPDAPAATAKVLLRAVDAYFRTRSALQNIIAFHHDTGYPLLAHGRGTLGHEQWGMMEALGQAGYRLTQRWLFFQRQLDALLPEPLPHTSGLTLHWETQFENQMTLIARSGTELIARAHILILPQPAACPPTHTALLYHFEVVDAFQGQGVGRWLLIRSANHLFSLGVTQLLEDCRHEDAVMQSRLFRLGFHEQPERGYSYEKATVRQ